MPVSLNALYPSNLVSLFDGVYKTSKQLLGILPLLPIVPCASFGQIGVVPLPSLYTTGNSTICLSSGFSIVFDGKGIPPDLYAAARRTEKQVKQSRHAYLSPLRGAEFFPDGRGCEQYLDTLVLSFTTGIGHSAHESIFNEAIKPVEDRAELEMYKLNVGSGRATMTASSALGLFRGLATFEQLFYRFDQEIYAPFGPYTIEDQPTFGWRSVMLDTARHFLPKDVLLRQLDTMALVKLNVLHWHITDATSWPLDLEAFADLSRGAFSPHEKYTERDIREIVQYAGERGIDVVLEIDTPGHTASLYAARPDHVACFDAKYIRHANEPPAGQLRFANDTVVDFAKDLYANIAELMPSRYISTGGDEVNVNCMMEDEPTTAVLDANNWTLDQALDNFANRTHAALRAARKTPTVWQEMVLHHNLTLMQNDTIVHTWLAPSDARKVLDKGYRVVHASAEYFYLDCGLGGWIGEEGGGNSWCDPYKSWARMHSFDPFVNVTDDQRLRVLGGQTSLWAEQVDSTNLETLLWPRAAALAEVFWTSPGEKGYPMRGSLSALPRMHDVRYRMVSRGVSATPLQPHWCALRPDRCRMDS